VFEVVITSAAQSDIRSNVVWWSENRSKNDAERWYVAAMEKIYSLEHFPFRCPIAKESEKFGIEIRHLLFGISTKHTHRVLYEVDASTVRVFRVLSTSQDASDFTAGSE
jgi:plasmid stabilization system protein ParE